jgi:polyhydroxyalkanoate synthase
MRAREGFMQTLSQENKNIYNVFLKNTEMMMDNFFDILSYQHEKTNRTIKELQSKLNELEIYEFDHHFKHLSIITNPKYYPFTNKNVIKKTLETNGENLFEGIKQLNDHLKKGILPSLTNIDHYKIGENIATSEGDVIYKNNIMELIHYKPIKKNTYEQPLLIIPPWINKFYIFDLTKEKSFIQFCLKKGIDTYIISWKNPDENDKTLTLGCYIEKGIKQAIDFIDKKIHVLGFCLGGVATTIASLTDKKNLIQSTSLLATPIDFSKLKEIQNYIKILDFNTYKKHILTKGYKCGKDLLRTFCLMRAENMIMDNAVNQYFLNEKPRANEFLYWNMDATNLPAVMHIEYLDRFFKKNLLYKGMYHYKGERLHLKNLKIPLFIFSAEKDHIVPPEGSLAIQKFSLNATYVVGGSGHIAGVINPPQQKKYHYKVIDEKGIIIKEKRYSWWNEWGDWILPKMGKKAKVSFKSEKKIDTAPGSYAKEQPALNDYINF